MKKKKQVNGLRKAAHIGPVGIKSVVKTSAKNNTPVYFYIEVPADSRNHFWDRAEGNLEFWAFKDRPRAFYGQKIIFTFDHQPVAEAKVLKMEEPGRSKCDSTGKYEKSWKVFWDSKEFKKYKIASNLQSDLLKAKKYRKQIYSFIQKIQNFLSYLEWSDGQRTNVEKRLQAFLGSIAPGILTLIEPYLSNKPLFYSENLSTLLYMIIRNLDMTLYREL